MYDREKLLISRGLSSFTPALRLVEELTRDAKELEEYKQFKIASAKKFLTHDNDFRTWFHNASEAAERRYRETGNLWEDELTSFERRLMKMVIEDSPELKKLQKRYRQERLQLWAEEVEKFSTGLSASEEWRSKPRVALCGAIMRQEEVRTGLILDKTMSTQASPAFSKQVGNAWKVAMKIDGVPLKQPIGPPGYVEETGEITVPSATFESWIEIRPLVSKRQVLRAACRLEFLFPIAERTLPPQHYRSFGSLRQLEALVRIHIEMFLLIQGELTQALLNEAVPG